MSSLQPSCRDRRPDARGRLAKMRALGLVKTRRDGHQIYYQLASQEVEEVLSTLYRLYCARKP